MLGSLGAEVDLKGANKCFPVAGLDVEFGIVGAETVVGAEMEGVVVSDAFPAAVSISTSISSIGITGFLAVELARPRPLRWGLGLLVVRFCSSSSSSASTETSDLVVCAGCGDRIADVGCFWRCAGGRDRLLP